MNKMLAMIAVFLAIFCLILGIIFLIAAIDAHSRILTGGAFLITAGLLLAYGLSTLRRITETSPEHLETGAVELAKQLEGEVTVEQLQAAYSIPAALAKQTLERLRAKGQCQLEQRGDYAVYLFKSVLPAKAVKRCPYCGSEFAVRSAVRKCPNCGAALEITKE